MKLKDILQLRGWRWAVKAYQAGDRWALQVFCLWIILWRARTPAEEGMESWGVVLHPEARYWYFTWGKHYWFVGLPWAWRHVKREVMLVGCRWQDWSPAGVPRNTLERTRPYRYTLRSGEVQEVQAKVSAERRTWHWSWFPFSWLGWPRKVETSIVVDFSAEVGEGAGSYKGGVLGCGWDLRPGETLDAALARMESQRRFEG